MRGKRPLPYSTTVAHPLVHRAAAKECNTMLGTLQELALPTAVPPPAHLMHG